ncbi:MAG: tRNA (adenosine(37)-N6)-threonylcarbamoyltransferase complex ATPase subunit type 1 TsaE [Bacteroidota bacterium]
MEDGLIKKIFHLDLYRLNDEEDAIRAGVEDCLYSNNICLVEWPEKARVFFRRIHCMFISKSWILPTGSWGIGHKIS